MEVLYKRYCGIDIHKNIMVACVFTSVRKKEIRQFSTMTEDILHNVKLSRIITDISGKSGMAILKLIISGESDPVILSELAEGKAQRGSQQRQRLSWNISN